MRKEQQVSTEDASRPISMPEELLRFIQRDTYSLLIKGFAGTGKTTLALTILRALGARDNFFYISTRISPKELFSYYPWLADFTQKSSDAGEGASGSGSDHSTMPTFEDARLDEPESLFERITNQLMDIKSPIIIIDSWDAIASFMDKEGRLNNERVLQTWRERAGAKLIFISEHPDDTTLDFLVGGVVELRQRQLDSVRFREIILLKLRGVRIGRPSYVYTLENSVFRSFDPYVPKKPSLAAENTGDQKKRPLEILYSNLVRTGYLALDRALGGGFARNSVVLVEYDEQLSLNVAMSFLAGLASNFVSAGNLVLVQPGGRIGPSEVMDIMNPALPSSKHDLVKILWPRKYSPFAENIIVQANYFASEATIARLKKKYGDKLLLNIIAGYSSLRAANNGEIDMKIKDQAVVSSARACDLSIVLINAANKDQFEYFSGFADAHLKLLMINNTLFLQPILPTSTLYAVEYGRNGQIILEAVV